MTRVQNIIASTILPMMEIEIRDKSVINLNQAVLKKTSFLSLTFSPIEEFYISFEATFWHRLTLLANEEQHKNQLKSISVSFVSPFVCLFL